MINKCVVRGGEIPNYSNAWESISMTIYSQSNPPSGFYVYAWIRNKDSAIAKAGTPYYIGKGKGGRAFIKRDFKPTDNRYIVILAENLTELGAFALERRMIRWYGRVDTNTGILRNLTDGGEGNAGQVRTPPNPETREKISQSNKGKQTRLGAVLSEETKEKIRLARAKQVMKPRSEESKEKMRQAAMGNKWSVGNQNSLGKKQSPESNLARSLALKGRTPWNKGTGKRNQA